MILTISKPPQYGENGEVIIGQCEVHTPGWRLRLVERGEEEVLLEGTYEELRRVQRLCAGASPEEVRRIVEEARKSGPPPEEPGRAAKEKAGSDRATREATQILGREEIRRAMMEEAGGAVQRGAASGGGPARRAAVPMRPEETGVLVERISDTLVVRFVDPELASRNCDALAVALEGVLAQRAQRFVLDLSLAMVLSSRLIREIVKVREQAVRRGCTFALVLRRREAVDTLASMNLVGFLPVFSDLEAALRSAQPLSDPAKGA